MITEEDKLLQTHLVVIKETANLLSEEGVLLKTYQNSEDPDLDSYVERLTSVSSIVKIDNQQEEWIG